MQASIIKATRVVNSAINFQGEMASSKLHKNRVVDLILKSLILLGVILIFGMMILLKNKILQ